MPLVDVDCEINIIKGIRNKEHHKKMAQEWLAELEILDSLSSQLSIADSPFCERKPLEIKRVFLTNDYQPIWYTIIDKLIHNNIINNTNGIFSGRRSIAAITSKPIEEIFEGKNITVTNRVSFENYRQAVQQICDFAILDGIERLKIGYKKLNTVVRNNHEFPPNLKWENIVIKFVNGTDIEIRLKNDPYFYRKADCTEMGLEDKKSRKPKKSWGFFQVLAAVHGSLSWEDNISISRKEREGFQKRKEELAKVLIGYFGIEEDPFKKYNKTDGYKIKIELIPEVENNKNRTINNPYSDLDEEVQKQSPSVFDKFEKN